MPIVLPDKNCGKLLSYGDSIANRLTLNTANFDWKLWLEIPRDIAKDLTLELVRELGISQREIDIETYIVREDIKPWLIINPNGLDFTPGFHMLQFIFRNQELQVYQSLYFSYTAQVDNPEKPYIYMNREETT